MSAQSGDKIFAATGEEWDHGTATVKGKYLRWLFGHRIYSPRTVVAEISLRSEERPLRLST